MSSSSKLKFGLIGCGAQGRFLAEALRAGGRVELAACADIHEDAANKAVEQCGFKQAYSTAQSMLDQAELDAVIVATTHDQLYPNALAAIKADKHVLVEKPIALNADDGRVLVDEAHQRGVMLMPGFSLRFMSERRFMKQLLDDNAVGAIKQVLVGQLIPQQSGWLDDPTRGGGPLYFVGSHIIDQLLWVVGQRPISVFARITRPSEDRAESDVLAILTFADGLIASVSTSQTLGGRYGWLDIAGTEGRIRCEWENQKVLVESKNIKAYRYPTFVDVPMDDGAVSLPFDTQASVVAWRYIYAWSTELDQFVTAIEQNSKLPVTGEEAVQTLEVIDAIFESQRTGCPVNLKSIDTNQHTP